MLWRLLLILLLLILLLLELLLLWGRRVHGSSIVAILVLRRLLVIHRHWRSRLARQWLHLLMLIRVAVVLHHGRSLLLLLLLRWASDGGRSRQLLRWSRIASWLHGGTRHAAVGDRLEPALIVLLLCFAGRGEVVVCVLGHCLHHLWQNDSLHFDSSGRSRLTTVQHGVFGSSAIGRSGKRIDLVVGVVVVVIHVWRNSRGRSRGRSRRVI